VVNRKRTLKRKSPPKTTTTRRGKWFARNKKDQQRLLRELLSVFLFVFGAMSLVVMYKTEAETGYALRQTLYWLFGVGSWIVSLVCFYLVGVILLPAKFWHRTQRFALAIVGCLFLLSWLELTLISDPAYLFGPAQTRGGILGYMISSFLVGTVGLALSHIILLGGITAIVLVLTNLSLSTIARHVRTLAQVSAEGIADLWYQIRLKLSQEDEEFEDNIILHRMEHRTEETNLGDEEALDLSPTDPALNEAQTPIEELDFRERNLPTPTITHSDDDEAPPAPERKSDLPAIWFMPPLDLLELPKAAPSGAVDQKKRAAVIEKTLESFGVEASVVEINVGPTITQYALEPAVGVKVSKITTLQNDLALALATAQIRIEAPIPGKPYVGIEVPNNAAATVTLRSILQTPDFRQSTFQLPIAMGRDVAGRVTLMDLARMPHLLIAGATGSGKSVAVNTFLGSLLYRYNPNQLKLILIDPKVVELTRYNGIPHLLQEVITRPDKTLSALQWAVGEMEKRYQRLAKERVRDIERFNQDRDELTKMPYIVIIIDELADLMMVSPVEVEEAICRIAQKARAVGIHLVVATQRPSVNVVTGLIKANIPGRICFAVASQMDSRVVLDVNGAEKLLGRGDMLFHSSESGKLVRLQGAFVSDAEVEKIVSFWSRQGEPDYIEEITEQDVALGKAAIGGEEDDDELLEDALNEILREGRASASLLQRRLRVGYARAARLIDLLENKGVLGPADGSKPRDILSRQLPGQAAPAATTADSDSLFDEFEGKY